MNDQAVIEVCNIVTRFGHQTVHEGVSFRVQRGELVALIGGSGSGKSVLVREIIGLLKPTAGQVKLLGQDMWAASESARAQLRRRFGMMFQDGALFSSLTVAQNIAVPLKEHTMLPASLIDTVVDVRLALAGLPRAAIFNARRGATIPQPVCVAEWRDRSAWKDATHRKHPKQRATRKMFRCAHSPAKGQ